MTLRNTCLSLMKTTNVNNQSYQTWDWLFVYKNANFSILFWQSNDIKQFMNNVKQCVALISNLFFYTTFTLFWACNSFLIWNMIVCGNFSAKNNLVTLLISTQFTSVLTSWYSVLSMTQQNENFYKKCKKMSTELKQSKTKQNSLNLWWCAQHI